MTNSLESNERIYCVARSHPDFLLQGSASLPPRPCLDGVTGTMLSLSLLPEASGLGCLCRQMGGRCVYSSSPLGLGWKGPPSLVDLEAVGGYFVQGHLFSVVSMWKLQVGAPEAFTYLLTLQQGGQFREEAGASDHKPISLSGSSIQAPSGPLGLGC